ncbi:MAG: hypothetical protein P8M78_07150 [Myxococcota bacterium]|nr:hypothetical protein [Myxococcota bacterium]
MRRICVHHAGCPDGFGAAWATWRGWGRQGEFIARGHEDHLRGEEVEDAFVAFVDIAPQNQELIELSDHAAHIVVLDHHITASTRLLGDAKVCAAVEEAGHTLHFDMQHSGAVLAWQHFQPDEPLPPLLEYVEDQDLWNWKLPHSEAVNAAISSHPHTLETWENLSQLSISELVRQGEPILRANEVQIQRAASKAAPIVIGENRLEAVNSTTNRARIGHLLAERALFGEPWGCVYRLEGKVVSATLYSIGDFDVSRIATSLGGGGHKNAAGFSVSLESWLTDFTL